MFNIASRAKTLVRKPETNAEWCQYEREVRKAQRIRREAAETCDDSWMAWHDRKLLLHHCTLDPEICAPPMLHDQVALLEWKGDDTGYDASDEESSGEKCDEEEDLGDEEDESCEEEDQALAELEFHQHNYNWILPMPEDLEMDRNLNYRFV